MLLFELLLLLFFTLLSAGRAEQTHCFSHVEQQEDPCFGGQFLSRKRGAGDKKNLLFFFLKL